MKFEITEEQESKLKTWQTKIKKKHGKYGLFTYKFTPYGMGEGVTVFSELTGEEVDLTEIDKW